MNTMRPSLWMHHNSYRLPTLSSHKFLGKFVQFFFFHNKIVYNVFVFSCRQFYRYTTINNATCRGCFNYKLGSLYLRNSRNVGIINNICARPSCLIFFSPSSTTSSYHGNDSRLSVLELQVWPPVSHLALEQCSSSHPCSGLSPW